MLMNLDLAPLLHERSDAARNRGLLLHAEVTSSGIGIAIGRYRDQFPRESFRGIQ